MTTEEVVNEVEGKIEKSIQFSANSNSNSKSNLNSNLSLLTDVETISRDDALSAQENEQEPEWDEDRGGSVSESEYKKYVKDADIEDYLRGTYVHSVLSFIL